MLSNMAMKAVYDRRRSLIWWALGILLLVVVMVASYPIIRDSSEDMLKLFEKMPKGMMEAFTGSADVGAILTPGGYLHSRMFGMILPIILISFCIGIGVRTVAGEEAAHTMDLLLANPVRRSQIVLQGFWAMLALALVLGAVNWLGTWALGFTVDLGLSLGDLLLATLDCVLLGLFFGALALLIGAATGNRGLSLGVPSAYAVGGYLFNLLAGSVEALRPLQLISPFYYSTGRNVILDGMNWLHAGLLAGLTALMVALSVVLFQRRDVAV